MSVPDFIYLFEYNAFYLTSPHNYGMSFNVNHWGFRCQIYPILYIYINTHWRPVGQCGVGRLCVFTLCTPSNYSHDHVLSFLLFYFISISLLDAGTTLQSSLRQVCVFSHVASQATAQVFMLVFLKFTQKFPLFWEPATAPKETVFVHCRCGVEVCLCLGIIMFPVMHWTKQWTF